MVRERESKRGAELPYFLAVNYTQTMVLSSFAPAIHDHGHTFPTKTNSIFNHNCTVMVMADLNAVHPTFHHTYTIIYNPGLEAIFQQKPLSFLGPDFNIVFTGRGLG